MCTCKIMKKKKSLHEITKYLHNEHYNTMAGYWLTCRGKKRKKIHEQKHNCGYDFCVTNWNLTIVSIHSLDFQNHELM